MSKAQISITDFSIGVTIAIILFIVLIPNLNTYPVRLNEEQDKNEMLITAFQTSDSLVKTAGSPSLWENNINNITVIGLAESDRNLSTNKVNGLIDMDYSDAKRFFGFYDFYFRILDYSNNGIIVYGLPFNGTSSVNLRRHIIYDDENAIMELTLWE